MSKEFQLLNGVEEDVDLDYEIKYYLLPNVVL